MKKSFIVFFGHSLHPLKALLIVDNFFTHMYGKYKGAFMIVMGCDGNNQLFHLAFAITKSEYINSWSWFLACIRVGVIQRKGLYLIFDGNPSLVDVVNDTYSG